METLGGGVVVLRGTGNLRLQGTREGESTQGVKEHLHLEGVRVRVSLCERMNREGTVTFDFLYGPSSLEKGSCMKGREGRGACVLLFLAWEVMDGNPHKVMVVFWNRLGRVILVFYPCSEEVRVKETVNASSCAPHKEGKGISSASLAVHGKGAGRETVSTSQTSLHREEVTLTESVSGGGRVVMGTSKLLSFLWVHHMEAVRGRLCA